MKPLTKAKLLQAQEWCDENDKSTEFMIQFMMDSAGVSHDCVMSFLNKQADAYERKKKREEANASKTHKG